MDENQRRIVVIGGGHVGVLTAWFLSQFKSNKVTVIESSPGIAMKTSFMNGGVLCPSLTYPWSNPSSITSFAKSLWSGDGFVSIAYESFLDMRFYGWMFKFLTNTIQSKVTENYRNSYLLAHHSMSIMNDILPFNQYKRTSKGSLQLFFSQQSRDQMWRRMDEIKCEKQLLSKEECMSLEPNLAVDRPFVGGIYSPDDSSGDIYMFTKAMQEKCVSNGVDFRFNTRVEEFVRDSMGDKVVSCVTAEGERIYLDDVIICAGNGSPSLGEKVGDEICSYPIQGYALEIPTKLPLQYNVTDDVSKLYSSPLAGSIRISGITKLRPSPDEKAGFEPSLVAALVGKVRPFFKGNFLEESQMKIHTCFRPQTPDDLPIIGKGILQNVWYNCGHGHLGFTRGVGSAHLLCSLMMGQQPAISPEPYSPLRF